MFRYLSRFAAVAALALLVSPVQAQFTGYGAGGQFLLLNKSVQEELKLSKEQLGKLKESVDKVLEGFKDKLATIRDLEPEARAKLMGAITEKTNTIVTEVLDKDQVKRLREIDLQQRGPLALYDPEIRKTLNIDEKQVEKLKDLASTTTKTIQKFHDAKEMKKVAEAMNEAMDKLSGILTDEQKKTWKEMLGKPFTPMADE